MSRSKILCETKQPPSIQDDLSHLANRVRTARDKYSPNTYLFGYTDKDIKNSFEILSYLLKQRSLDKMINSGEDFIIGKVDVEEQLYLITRSIRKITSMD